MSRPERFELYAARRLEPAACAILARRPPPKRQCGVEDGPQPCAGCPDELRCPFRALARLLGG